MASRKQSMDELVSEVFLMRKQHNHEKDLRRRLPPLSFMNIHQAAIKKCLLGHSKLLIGQQATERRGTRAIDYDRTAQSAFPFPTLTREICRLPARFLKALFGPAM